MKHSIQNDGGITLLLQAQPLAEGQPITPEQLEQTRAILYSRLTDIGVFDPLVTLEAPDRIRVEAPGSGPVDDLRALLAPHLLLEIVDGGSNPPAIGSHISTDLDIGAPPSDKPDSQGDSTHLIWHTILTTDDIDPARVSFTQSPTGSPDIRFAFTTEGANKLADFTAANAGKYLPFLLDKQVISAPLIIEPLRSGEAAITTANPTQAITIFVQLKYGPLPLNVQELDAVVVPPLQP